MHTQVSKSEVWGEETQWFQKCQGERGWPYYLTVSLGYRVNFKAPVTTHTQEGLPMEVFSPWEEDVLYDPYPILLEDTAE